MMLIMVFTGVMMLAMPYIMVHFCGSWTLVWNADGIIGYSEKYGP